MQILMLLASTYFTYRFIEVYVHYKNSTASEADGLNVYHLRHMRLTVLETRQGARSSVASVGLASMQGLLDGCKIPLRGALSGNATTLFCTRADERICTGNIASCGIATAGSVTIPSSCCRSSA